MLIGEPVVGRAKKWVKVSDRNMSMGRSEENKKVIDKTNIASTSYSIEEVEDKKIKAIYKKTKWVCCL